MNKQFACNIGILGLEPRRRIKNAVPCEASESIMLTDEFRHRIRRAVRSLGLIILLAPFLLLLTGQKGCGDESIAVPPPNSDQAPVITIVNFVPGGQGDVDKSSVTSSSTVNVSDNTKLMITGNANNPAGGVKSFSMKFTCWPGGNVCQSIQTSAAPDQNNKVPTILRILGSNGSGGPGGQAVLFTGSGQDWGVVLDAAATNFNGMTTTIKVTYQVTPTPPTIVSFDAAPNNGYVNVGDSATLSWTVSCSHQCNYSLQGHDGLNNLVLNMPNVSSISSRTVKPAWDTKYTLTATNNVGTVSKDKWVTLYASGHPAGSEFYFKMTCQGCLNPCFTLAIYAPDAPTAKALAENQNGGYAAMQIDQNQFLTACQ